MKFNKYELNGELDEKAKLKFNQKLKERMKKILLHFLHEKDILEFKETLIEHFSQI